MQSKSWLVLEILAWNTYSSGKTPPLQRIAEKLISLYLDDNIGVVMSSMSLARGTPGALCFAEGSRGEPAGNRWRHAPAGRAGGEEAVER
ncbi:MAG: hypothetical protein QXD20_09165 [Ignisphaera sp.]